MKKISIIGITIALLCAGASAQYTEITNRLDLFSRVTNLNNVVFRNLTGTNSGGAIFMGGSSIVTINNALFETNSTTGSASGGAIYSSGSRVTVSNATFTGNSSGSNGGAVCRFLIETLTLTDVSFYNNTATGNGGAIYSSGSSGAVTLNVSAGKTSTFSGNRAANGNGIYMDAGSLTVNTIGDGVLDMQDSAAINSASITKNGTGVWKFGEISALSSYMFINAGELSSYENALLAVSRISVVSNSVLTLNAGSLMHVVSTGAVTSTATINFNGGRIQAGTLNLINGFDVAIDRSKYTAGDLLIGYNNLIGFANDSLATYISSNSGVRVEYRGTGQKGIYVSEVFTVTFNGGGGTHTSGGAEVQEVYPGESAVAPVYTRTGYTFASWDKPLTNITADTTITARWTTNQYTVSFNMNASGVTGASAKPGDLTRNYNTTVGAVTAPTATSHNFDGWIKGSNSGPVVANIATEVVTSNVAYYAKWSVKSFTVLFNGGGGTRTGGGAELQTINYGAAATAPVYSRTGYTQNGWDRTFNNITAATTVTARWTTNSYSVSYNANGGSGAAMANSSHTYNIAKALSANTYARSNYTFAGWATSAGGTVVHTDSKVVSNLTATANGTVPLYAVWAENAKFTVSFNTDGGSAVAPQSVYSGSKAVRPADPVKTNYTFAGWYTSSALTTVFDFGTPITAATTLYAKWTEVVYQALTFFFMDGATAPVVTNLVVGSTYNLPVPPPRGAGYTFEGWYTEPGLGGVKVESTDTVSGSVTALFARWKFNGWQFVRVWDGGWLLNVAQSNATDLTVLSVVDTPSTAGTVDFAKKVEYGYKFKTVGAAAFKGCSALTGVTLGDVVNINAEAFYGSMLASVSIDESLTICSNAFGSTPMKFILARSGAPTLTGNLIEEVKTVYYMPGNDDADWEGQFRSRHNNTVALRSSIDVATLTEDAAGFSFNIASTGLNDVPLDIKVYATDSLTVTNWVEVRTITGGLDGALFTDPASTNYPSRFYKTAVTGISI